MSDTTNDLPEYSVYFPPKGAEPPACPKCGTQTVRIQYGEPPPEPVLLAAIARLIFEGPFRTRTAPVEGTTFEERVASVLSRLKDWGARMRAEWERLPDEERRSYEARRADHERELERVGPHELGGCIIHPSQPWWACPSCRWRGR
jgi:hypothetical protein